MSKIDTAPFRRYVKNLEKTQAAVDKMGKESVNLVTDRHLARIKKNTDVGDSPDSPSLRNAWDRSGVHVMSDAIYSEVFNPMEHAPYYEFGHRQEPGKLIFIELMPGQQKYGQAAREVKTGKHQGKWGIFLRLKKSFVKGRFVMTDSESKSQQELDAQAKKILDLVRKGWNGT